MRQDIKERLKLIICTSLSTAPLDAELSLCFSDLGFTRLRTWKIKFRFNEACYKIFHVGTTFEPIIKLWFLGFGFT